MVWDWIVSYIEKSRLDWTAIVSLGGLAVAALALILNYNVRKVPFQQALHLKQIDAALEMMTKLRDFQDTFFSVVHPATKRSSEQDLSVIRQEIGCLITRLLYDLVPTSLSQHNIFLAGRCGRFLWSTQMERHARCMRR